MATVSSVLLLMVWNPAVQSIRTKISEKTNIIDSQKYFNIEREYENRVLKEINCILVSQKIPKRGTIRLVEDKLEIFSYLVNILNNIFYYSQELNI